ncbi:hypothetical protein QC762_0075620 [Podospora pseudocomata]|uniref:Uncharacterized protein n=1 Tax=Podospora pseudocomata TaxID=2093779 RepID=A0ABR0GAA9_9PEZI|nr:hypothetical protein QC762_0075620 [Podospora pseudocomata]
MRCTGSPCQGTYYWRDPDNRSITNLIQVSCQTMSTTLKEITYSGLYTKSTTKSHWLHEMIGRTILFRLYRADRRIRMQYE